MIGKLKGRIDSTDEDSLILDVGGVGYHVFCSGRTLASIGGTGDFAELIIETHVREDHIHLFGFPNVFERDWFRLLTTVQGVGVKMGMAILNSFSPEQLTTAIAAKDVKALTSISGVGPKLAERLATELKSKVSKMPVSGLVIHDGKKMPLPAPSLSEDAISALVSLGYNRSDAFSAIGRAAQKLGEKAALDGLIKEGLKELAR